MGVHNPVLEKNQPRIRPAGLIKAVKDIARALVDTHHADVRSAPKRLFQTHYGEIGVWIGSARTGVYVHHT